MAGAQQSQQSQMQIKYNNHLVKQNQSPFTLNETRAEPTLLNPPIDTTIFLIDPKGPEQPFLHWAIYIDPNGQREILQPYYPPTPPKGIHTYTFYSFSGKYNGIIKHYPFNIPSNLMTIGMFSVAAAN